MKTLVNVYFYDKAAILGVAFVALVLGAIGVLITICHTYFRYTSVRNLLITKVHHNPAAGQNERN